VVRVVTVGTRLAPPASLTRAYLPAAITLDNEGVERERIAIEVQPGQAGARVVVADDDVLLREGLGSLLTRSGYRVVGQAGDAVSLLELVRAEKPELAIVDIRMPPTGTTDGLDAAMVIREEMPEVGMVILSAHVAVEHATQLLASGRGVGYLLKTRVTDVGDFLDTLGRITDGACVVDPALVAELGVRA
jgi:DNA-binding NarL/FixJ family response regulator